MQLFRQTVLVTAAWVSPCCVVNESITISTALCAASPGAPGAGMTRMAARVPQPPRNGGFQRLTSITVAGSLANAAIPSGEARSMFAAHRALMQLQIASAFSAYTAAQEQAESGAKAKLPLEPASVGDGTKLLYSRNRTPSANNMAPGFAAPAPAPAPTADSGAPSTVGSARASVVSSSSGTTSPSKSPAVSAPIPIPAPSPSTGGRSGSMSSHGTPAGVAPTPREGLAGAYVQVENGDIRVGEYWTLRCLPLIILILHRRSSGAG